MDGSKSYLDGKVIVHAGDCLDVIRTLADNSIDSVVTDPPYALVSVQKRLGKLGSAPIKSNGATGVYARGAAGFMGKQWDTGDVAFSVEFWAEVLRVLKPGGHVLAFGGTRTYHRLACAIEDAGFEIRDQIGWAFGSGFPKSHDVSKGIDRAAGVEREVVGAGRWNHVKGNNAAQADCLIRPGGKHNETAPATSEAIRWQGWGTALKPAWEPICVARKPLSEGTVAANVLKWGTGAINVDGCRIEGEVPKPGNVNPTNLSGANGIYGIDKRASRQAEWEPNKSGRWPANLIHDGSDEVVAAFPETHSAGAACGPKFGRSSSEIYGVANLGAPTGNRIGDNGGSAARFFYSAKADSDDRLGSKHPTVKPLDLMQWLVRLVTPKGGLVLDPFAGTGTTGEAAFREGCRAILIEREPEYLADIERRMGLVLGGPTERRHAIIKAKAKPEQKGSLL
jgi:site-specific DNA-methyltransferase (adenine-specific)